MQKFHCSIPTSTLYACFLSTICRKPRERDANISCAFLHPSDPFKGTTFFPIRCSHHCAPIGWLFPRCSSSLSFHRFTNSPTLSTLFYCAALVRSIRAWNSPLQKTPCFAEATPKERNRTIEHDQDALNCYYNLVAWMCRIKGEIEVRVRQSARLERPVSAQMYIFTNNSLPGLFRMFKRIHERAGKSLQYWLSLPSCTHRTGWKRNCQ